MKKRYLILLTAVLLFPLLSLSAQAADVDVFFTDPTAVAGNSVTVRAYTDKEIAGIAMTLVYDPEYLTYTGFSGGLGGADVKDNGGSLSIVDYSPSGQGTLSLELHFTANTVGTTTLRPTACTVSDTGGDTMEVEYGSHSSTVSITTASVSGDCRLSAIYIYPGTLTPAFSPEITTYAVTVANDTTWLAVTPELSDGDARYTVSDNSLQEGVNTITVNVTAPNGSERAYTLKVTRQPLHPAATPIPTAEPTASARPTSDADRENTLTTAETLYEILPAEDSPVAPEHCVPGNTVLDGRTLRAYLPEKPGEDYVIFYARREGGDPALYRFDTRERTMQRLSLTGPDKTEEPEPAPLPEIPTEDYAAQLRSLRLKMGIFACSAAVCLVAAVTMGLFLSRKRK